MKEIIPPVPRKEIETELTQDKFIRKTNYGSNEIYIVTYHDSPATLREVGRLREISFRLAGGGTGKDCDIDDYDRAEEPYKQIIVWDPEQGQIVGGYRFYNCHKTPPKKRKDGSLMLATSGLLNFSSQFVEDYLPHTFELGRSFVQPDYQSSKSGRKSLFALDNLWDGLGSLVLNDPDIKYLFGKITMYTTFNKKARDLILYFLKTFFPDKDQLVTPKKPLGLYHKESELAKVFTGKDYKENYKILSREVRNLGENIPPMFNSYMNVSPSMRTFGTAINEKFGGVEETGIMVTLSDIYESKKHRHISTYERDSNAVPEHLK